MQDVKVRRVMRDFVKDCIKFLGKGKNIKPLRRVFMFGCIFIFRTWIYRIPDSDCIFLLNIVMYINIHTVDELMHSLFSVINHEFNLLT